MTPVSSKTLYLVLDLRRLPARNSLHSCIIDSFSNLVCVCVYVCVHVRAPKLYLGGGCLSHTVAVHKSIHFLLGFKVNPIMKRWSNTSQHSFSDIAQSDHRSLKLVHFHPAIKYTHTHAHILLSIHDDIQHLRTSWALSTCYNEQLAFFETVSRC